MGDADVTTPDPNRSRHGDLPGGAYESYFIRANHPQRALGFWIRYTLFRPQDRIQDAIGEIWCVLFDGERGRHVAVRRQYSWTQCKFSQHSLDVSMPGAVLTAANANGEVPENFSWNLDLSGVAPPIFLLPERFYKGRFPAAKSLVVKPSCRFDGELCVEGVQVPVDGWIGSVNHNWGSRHTDRYAWGQVAGFDDHPDTFLEVASAWLKFGPISAPPMSPLVLRHRGEAIAANGLLRSALAKVTLDEFDWRFSTKNQNWDVECRIFADRSSFVGLAYGNPPGGVKHCLNTKIACCELTLRNRRSGDVENLFARDRAAFEILTDPRNHGVPIVAGFGVD